MEVRHFSTSKSFRKERVTLCKNDLPLDSIAGFVTCSSEGIRWLACVVNQEESTVNLTFFHFSGPLNSFKYPEQDVRSVPLESILTLVDPRTRTGHVYTLSRNKVTAASKALLTEFENLTFFYFGYELYYMLTCYGCINGSLYVPFLIFSVFF